MTDEELKQVVESNARAIQAMLDAMVEARQEREEFRDGMLRLQNVVERLTIVQEGIANLLASIDEDRPTIFRKIAAIESKVDRLLERKQEGEDR
ncbi:hypothetical protein [Microseira wollei]|uniref:Uncharacterized protein n=1 Tax=Microseira wollei NIES-4236 TaxID=2530354 RepID=A0AAV3X046_9CYAN|nr:hypothetical protein [Microseira wollei]GET35513.1 hypothetical protein MiSe_02550 [Microseira wollei NIES-4236]